MRWVIGRGVVGSLLLTFAAFEYAPMPRPSRITDDPVVVSLREWSHSLSVGLLVSLVGVLLLTWAWWDLRVFAQDKINGVRSVRIALAGWSVPLLVAPPIFSGDGWSYVATGYLTGHGRSPYTATPSELPPAWQSAVNSRWLDTPSPYGPLPHAWGGVASHVLSSPWLMLIGYRVLAILGVVLLAWATPRLAARCGQPGGMASWMVLASPFMLVNGIGGMHVDVLVAGFAAAALTLTRPTHWFWGSVLAGAAAAVKIPGGLVAFGVVLLSLSAGAGLLDRIRRTVEVALIAGGTLLALGVVTGVGTGWLSALSVPRSLSGRLSVSHDLGWLTDGLFRLVRLDDLLGHPDTIGAFELAGMVGAVVAASFVVLAQPTDDDNRDVRTVALVMLGATVLSPLVHYWYFLWGVPLLACLPLTRKWQGVLAGGVVALGIASVADGALHIGWFDPATMVLLALGAFAGFHSDRLRRLPAPVPAG